MAITIKYYTNETTNPAKTTCAVRMHSRSPENLLANTSLMMQPIIKQDPIPIQIHAFTAIQAELPLYYTLERQV